MGRSMMGPYTFCDDFMQLFWWGYGAGVIVDDPPAFGKALPDQREDTTDVAFVFVAREVPVAQNERAVVAGEMKLELGEIEVPHGGSVGVSLFVACANGVETALDATGAGEGEFGGIPIGGHEGIDVAFVPLILLIHKELHDRGAVFGMSVRGRLCADGSGHDVQAYYYQ